MRQAKNESECRVIVLGSTGSIGTQTLEVIEHLNALHARGEWGRVYRVVGLAAGNNKDLLRAQAARFGVAKTVCRAWAAARAGKGAAAVSMAGDDAEALVRSTDCDLVVAAISGIAGLPATLAAVELGRDIALANKETLVAAGALVAPAAAKSGARLLPVDSEHSGVWQCLATRDASTCPPCGIGDEVSKVTLTASGGPFRTWSKAQIEQATVNDALKHPTWRMGRKVTIDSASLMNKALEIVEAHWLFGLPARKLGALIHPQSIVHAMVTFRDGSTVSQMGAPDMRTPIQYALTWPGRVDGLASIADAAARMEFEEPDLDRFPALSLAYCALNEGGSSGAVLNAANETAVEAFLAGRIAFPRIADLTRRAMDAIPVRPIAGLNDVAAVDAEARGHVEDLI